MWERTFLKASFIFIFCYISIVTNQKLKVNIYSYEISILEKIAFLFNRALQMFSLDLLFMFKFRYFLVYDA